MKNKTLFLFLFISQLNAFSQELVRQQVIPCEGAGDTDFIHQNRLISKSIIDDTLALKIGLVRNCDFLPDIKINQKADSLLLNIQNGSQLFAACKCYFEIELQIIGITDTNFLVYYNHEVADINEKGFVDWTETLEMKQSSKYTLPTLAEINNTTNPNQYYQDSLKIGLWLKESTGKRKREMRFFSINNEKGQAEVLWYVLYNEAGTIEEVCTKSRLNGDIKSTSICADWEDYTRLMNPSSQE